MNALGIKHIVGRVSHPQTNGKVERFYGTVKGKIDCLNTEILETPEEAFYRKLDRGGDHGK